MKVKIFDTKEALFADLSKKIVAAINNKSNINLGLATGSTPIPLYQALIAAYREGLVSFKDVKTFNLDEYLGLVDYKNSYHYFMKEQLFNHVDIIKENTYIPNAFLDSIEDEVIRYDNLLAKNPIDIQILGIGSNGHIGFNEPGVSFNHKTLAVTLAEETRKDNKRFFEDESLVPTQAITMGIGTIMEAKEIILIATGENKSQAIKKTIEGEITEQVPASILQRHKNITIYLDKKAAKLLKWFGSFLFRFI